MVRGSLAAVLSCACAVCGAFAAEEASPLSDDAEQSSPQAEAPAIIIPKVLDLATAERVALAGNPTLQAAEERIKQAKARVRQARALWFPFVDLTGSAAKVWLSEKDYRQAKDAVSAVYLQALQQQLLQGIGEQAGSFSAAAQQLQFWQPGQVIMLPDFVNNDLARDLFFTTVEGVAARHAVDDSFEDYRVSLTASWIIFNGFDRKFANAQARFGKEEIEASYHEAKRLLLSGVAQAYHGAQLAREDVAIAEADQGFNARLLKEAQARQRVGSGSLSDTLNFEVRVNAAQTSLILARRSYALALISLAELLGLPDSAFPEGVKVAELLSESLSELDPPAVEPLLEYAKENRPELIQQEYTVKRADAGVGRARSAFYPTVAASASKDALRDDDFKFREDDFSTTVGVSVSYNLFAGGGDVARVGEAKAALSEARHTLTQTELAVTADVREALENLKMTQEQLVLQRANAALVERTRDLVDKEYSAGVAELVRLNEAQRDLVQAQGNLALARVSLWQAWHNLRTATAETLESHAD